MKRAYPPLLISLLFLLFSESIFSQATKEDPKPLPDHELIFRNKKGDTVALSKMQGKVVFINIWASWCAPCLDEMPGLHKLYNQYQDNENLVFLFVDADGDLKSAHRFLDKKGYKIPVFESVNGFPRNWFSGALPTTMIFDKKGVLIMHYEGSADYTNENFLKSFNDYLQKT